MNKRKYYDLRVYFDRITNLDWLVFYFRRLEVQKPLDFICSNISYNSRVLEKSDKITLLHK